MAGLCSWTKSMAVFYGVNKEVLPLKANLAVQQVLFDKAQEELNTAQAALDEKESELAKVRALYDEAMRRKQVLIDDAETCRRKIRAASTLIDGLGGEKKRWTEQSKEFQAQIGRLVGDVLLASAFLSYSGPFNQEYRMLLMVDWKKQLQTRSIPFSSDLNVTSMLADSTTVGEWSLQGLPNDELSVQNGIVVTKATRFPLLIDSLLLGKPLLVEDVEEELDPCLDNVLEKNFIKAGTILKVSKKKEVASNLVPSPVLDRRENL